jgi:N-acyl-D-amino-acid deacylase
MKQRIKTIAELLLLAAILLVALAPHNVASEPNDVPVTGSDPPHELRKLDSSVRTLMRKWNVPGAAVAVMRNGKLIFSRGYGYSEIASHKAVDPTQSLFRIASVSKPITAAATLRLVQDGKIKLDDKAFEILDEFVPKGRRVDRRLAKITVRDLLNMSAGWDKERSGDPILQPYIQRAARTMHVNGPADFDTTVRYMMGRKLDFTPGTKFAYSNFAYGLLGKIVEKASGKDYESYVRETLFAPCGVQLYQAHTREEDRLPQEVYYYAPLESKVRSFLPTRSKKVAAPYARAYMEADLPILGWVATAPELAVLVDKLLTDENLLTPEVREQVLNRPSIPCWSGRNKYFSMGWEVNCDDTGHYSVFKDGTLPGTRAFAEHTADGITWVALFNARPPQKQPDKFALQIKQLMAGNLQNISANRQEGRPRQAFSYRPQLEEDVAQYKHHFGL